MIYKQKKNHSKLKSIYFYVKYNTLIQTIYIQQRCNYIAIDFNGEKIKDVEIFRETNIIRNTNYTITLTQIGDTYMVLYRTLIINSKKENYLKGLAYIMVLKKVFNTMNI